MNEQGRYTYDYPRPVVTVDAIPITVDNGKVKTLLIQRDKPPFPGHWALPGGHVDEGEDPDAAVIRELEEETHLIVSPLQVLQLGAWGKPGRDPRGHYISITYLVFCKFADLMATRPDDDAREIRIETIEFYKPDIKLAFDHEDMMHAAIKKLQRWARLDHWSFLQQAGRWMLDKRFAAGDLRDILTAITWHHYDQGNWHREVGKEASNKLHGCIREDGEEATGRRRRLYTWTKDPDYPSW